MNAYGVDALSERELEVVRTWIQVGRNALVADRLKVSQQTIKNHISSILAKLGANSIGQAAILIDRHDRGWSPSWPDVERRRLGERRRGERRRGGGA